MRKVTVRLTGVPAPIKAPVAVSARPWKLMASGTAVAAWELWNKQSVARSEAIRFMVISELE